MRLAITYDEAFLEHAEYGHPERPERLVAIVDSLVSAGYWEQATSISAREATVEELARVHTKAYVESTLARLERAPGHLDPDTYFSAGSRLAALKAAGGGVDLARAVWSREADLGLALVRPPGHHAEANRAAGFCIFNNVAVAAAALLADGVERVLIFDWDVHHGNGTQHEFEDTPHVLYVSVHAWPHYPGSGLSHEIGTGAGEGYTANVPYPHGASDVAYAAVVDRLVAPLARAYEPQIILVSAGFDSHRNDLLGGMLMTEEGFGYMAAVIRDLAAELCGGRVALFLEGGYDLEGLSASMVRVIQTFDGGPAPRPQGAPSPRHERVLAETISQAKRYWPTLE
jgi:acetoin utilization deacetylase AcuC-like enzyme